MTEPNGYQITQCLNGILNNKIYCKAVNADFIKSELLSVVNKQISIERVNQKGENVNHANQDNVKVFIIPLLTVTGKA